MGVPTAKAPREHSEGGPESTAVGATGGLRDLQTKQKQTWRLFLSSHDLGAPWSPSWCLEEAVAAGSGLVGQELKSNVEGLRH